MTEMSDYRKIIKYGCLLDNSGTNSDINQSNKMTTPNIEETLQERGNRYGEFEDHAEVTQALKEVMNTFLCNKGKHLSTAHQEALEMIFHKIGRILNGDPNYKDSWHDISGYAKLGEDSCKS